MRLTHKLRTQFATMKGVEMGQFITLCSRFAATPSDRSKVAVEQPKESSLSKFLKVAAPTRFSKSPAKTKHLPLT